VALVRRIIAVPADVADIVSLVEHGEKQIPRRARKHVATEAGL